MTFKIVLTHLDSDGNYYSKLSNLYSEDDESDLDADNIKESLSFATPTNTTGMGDIIPPTENSIGSGDVFDNVSGGVKKEKK